MGRRSGAFGAFAAAATTLPAKSGAFSRLAEEAPNGAPKSLVSRKSTAPSSNKPAPELSLDEVRRLLEELRTVSNSSKFQKDLADLRRMDWGAFKKREAVAKLLSLFWKAPLRKYGFSIDANGFPNLLRVVKEHGQQPGIRLVSHEVERQLRMVPGTLFGLTAAAQGETKSWKEEEIESSRKTAEKTQATPVVTKEAIPRQVRGRPMFLGEAKEILKAFKESLLVPAVLRTMQNIEQRGGVHMEQHRRVLITQEWNPIMKRFDFPTTEDGYNAMKAGIRQFAENDYVRSCCHEVEHLCGAPAGAYFGVPTEEVLKAQKAAEAEEARKAEEKQKAEELRQMEAKRRAEEAKLKAEAEERRRAEEAAQRKAEEEARRQAEEEKREAEEARREAEEQEKQKAQEEARREAEEQEKQKAEEEARREAEEQEKEKAEEARKQAEAAKREEEDERSTAEEEQQDEAQAKLPSQDHRLAELLPEEGEPSSQVVLPSETEVEPPQVDELERLVEEARQKSARLVEGAADQAQEVDQQSIPQAASRQDPEAGESPRAPEQREPEAEAADEATYAPDAVAPQPEIVVKAINGCLDAAGLEELEPNRGGDAEEPAEEDGEHDEGEERTRPAPAQEAYGSVQENVDHREPRPEALSKTESVPDDSDLECYDVVHTQVALRAEPSRGSKIVGAVSKGAQLLGTPQSVEGQQWLQVSASTCAALGAFAESAWALVHGGDLGLGALLRPAARLQPQPLGYAGRYEVAHSKVAVRAAPSMKGKVVGVVLTGRILMGTPHRAGGLAWLRFEESSRKKVAETGEEAWALIDGQPLGLGQLLRPLDNDGRKALESFRAHQAPDATDATPPGPEEPSVSSRGPGDKGHVSEPLTRSAATAAKVAGSAREAKPKPESKPEPKPEAPATAIPDPAKVESRRKAAQQARDVLSGPLEYKVLAEDHAAPVRREPLVQSPEVGKLERGQVVLGYPGGGWLQLVAADRAEEKLDGCWVFIGTRLSAEWAELNVTGEFEGALELAWPGLRKEKRVAYNVEWRTPEGNPNPKKGHKLSIPSKALVTGLPHGCELSFRVGARVAAGNDKDEEDVRLFGSWTQLLTGQFS